MDQLQPVATHHLGRLVPEQPGHSRAGVLQLTVIGNDQDEIGSVFDDRAKPLFAVLDGSSGDATPSQDHRREEKEGGDQKTGGQKRQKRLHTVTIRSGLRTWNGFIGPSSMALID